MKQLRVVLAQHVFAFAVVMALLHRITGARTKDLITLDAIL
jgi:hypothetical protein